MAIPSFVDRATLTAVAGKGGHGCASVKREKFKPLGAPTVATAAMAGL
ncbi:GTP-binding protein Obg [Cutibacterium acnes JCM 18916]|nr:GTP1/OBG family [Cutibacterium acnes 266]EFD02137.1 hypothetical protein HMPREF1034_2422 [Cutibacterium acnes SK187]EFD07736.1 hypothetical protein HMPREF9207_0332 [Cutibacterium acnes J165]EHC26286.1 hypothetical protein HMPREF1003_01339 [Propionibacterium sp. 5_U_42AFAA]GAE72615.1 GTP-binding protein Obg [Cutibacterium acnes JCM 18916]